jgi:hypothetical protein
MHLIAQKRGCGGCLVQGDAVGHLLAEGKASAPFFFETAQECRKLLDQLSGEIRTMSYLLHPPLLDGCRPL